MRLGIGVAILVGVAILHSVADGQNILGANWFNDLNRSLGSLNRNIQANVQQLNQRISETVATEVAQVQQLTDNLNKGITAASVGTAGANIVAGGNKLITSYDNGMRTVLSGRTADGTAYVTDITESINGDTLRHVVKVYYPKTNVTTVHGFTLDLGNPGAKPVPIVGSKV